MRAAVVDDQGSSDVADVPDPGPGPGEPARRHSPDEPVKLAADLASRCDYVVRPRTGDPNGIGVLEQFPFGPHERSGLTDLLGGYGGMKDA